MVNVIDGNWSNGTLTQSVTTVNGISTNGTRTLGEGAFYLEIVCEGGRNSIGLILTTVLNKGWVAYGDFTDSLYIGLSSVEKGDVIGVFLDLSGQIGYVQWNKNGSDFSQPQPIVSNKDSNVLDNIRVGMVGSASSASTIPCTLVYDTSKFITPVDKISELFKRNISSFDGNYSITISKFLLSLNNKVYSLQSEQKLYEPKMTSNNLPVPYVATSSGVAGSTYQPYWAFSGKSDLSINNAWYSNTTSNLWIQLNLGTLTKINKFTIKGMLNHYTLGMSDINSISLSASNDGANYDSIKTFNKDYWGVWNKNEVKEFLLDDIIEYKIYKISFTSSVNKVIIGDISFKLEYDTFFELPSDSVNNFINYGSQSIEHFNAINTNKNYVLSNTESIDTDGLLKTQINRKPLSIKFN